MKRELTDRQAEVLAYIKKYISEYRVAPSMRGIAERFDMQVSRVWQHVKALEAKGHVKRLRVEGRAVARGMTVVD